jgi:dihydrofolate reductase
MICSVFIATSADGFIADKDGDIGWLSEAGKSDVDMGNHSDMGFKEFLTLVDCMIMGRKTMEKILSFNLTPEQWPYGDLRIIVLSNTLKSAPANLCDMVEVNSGKIPELLSQLEKDGFNHAYIDGGETITNFLNLGLINEMIITRAPVLLGEGIPLFGKIASRINLENTKVTAFPNDFIQVTYKVNYQ